MVIKQHKWKHVLFPNPELETKTYPVSFQNAIIPSTVNLKYSKVKFKLSKLFPFQAS